MEDKMFPKYQYSVFLKNGRDEQVVIRANDFKEFLELKANVNKILEKVEHKATAAPVVTTNPQENVCPIHGVGMEKKNGKYGEFFSHYIGKTPEGKPIYCNGK